MKPTKALFGISALLLLSISLFSCKEKKEEKQKVTKEKEAVTENVTGLPLDRLQLPEGFKIELFAEGIPDARSMTMGDKGTLFVGTRSKKKLYAVQDTNGDHKADNIMILDSAYTMPNGVAFRDGNLYVADVSRLLRYKDIEKDLTKLPEPEVIYDDYPTDLHHGWKYIAFGPDGKLYVPVGAPCNICDNEDTNEMYASITRMNPDGSDREVYAKGVRNTVGFTWHPETKELWFTDNGRDRLGDDVPPCELNKATQLGQHFGYPYCHGGTIKDPEFGDKYPCADFVVPEQNLGAHVAPLAVKFYTGDMFPEKYKGKAFIAEHGSWNRSSKVGYKISLVTLENNKAVRYEPFIEGWLDEPSQEAFGRPVDILMLDDGSFLISDDFAGAIYRVSYADTAVASAE
ncbi:PQQ-dependent sugar dehydrogenase [Spongiimicrobium salis]|uniref:PQQ-dependent sugar dehydrogenase n=1 Tax=Spongiimicrobium salis TaxID=1667022 RepID=UPI00374DD89C